MVADALIAGRTIDEALLHVYEVTDEATAIVLTLPFTDAVEIDTSTDTSSQGW